MDNASRVVIEHVEPEVDGGRFAIKRVCGERVVVEADIFADGHGVLAAVLQHRREEAQEWTETAMAPLGNDRWRGEFVVAALGRYRYTILGWVDRFASWVRDLGRWVEAGQDVAVDLEIELHDRIEALQEWLLAERALQRASLNLLELLGSEVETVGANLIVELQLGDRVADRGHQAGNELGLGQEPDLVGSLVGTS